MKIIGFGDYLMHFSPFGNERFMQVDAMRLRFTGAEAIAWVYIFWKTVPLFVPHRSSTTEWIREDPDGKDHRGGYPRGRDRYTDFLSEARRQPRNGGTSNFLTIALTVLKV